MRRLLYAPGVRPLRHCLVVALALVPACVLNLGDDDPEPCPLGGGATGAPINTRLLNPDTLVCEDAGTCDACGACDLPSWGACQSQCSGLDARSCGATSGCRQAWDELCLLTDAICPLPDDGYLGCFAVDNTGPVQGACDGLAGQACSRHDDCIGTYRRGPRCTDGLDSDGDGAVDEPDECLTFGSCIAEFNR